MIKKLTMFCLLALSLISFVYYGNLIDGSMNTFGHGNGNYSTLGHGNGH